MQELSSVPVVGQPPTAQAEPEPTKFRIPRWTDKVFLLVGFSLLVYVLSRYPLAELGRACLRVGPWVAVTPFIAMGWFACNTSALYLLLDKQVPWLQLFRIRLIGDGYNALLPLAGMGGEPYRIKHVSAFVPLDRALTALIRDRVIENGVGFVFTSLCLGLALVHFAFASALRAGMLTYIAVASTAGCITVLLVVTSLPSRFSVSVSKLVGKGAEGADPLPLVRLSGVLFWYFGARAAGMVEAAVLLRILGLGSDLTTIAFCYSFLQAAGSIGFAIPAGLGVFEGATVYMFSILAFPGPLGVAYALARRGRMLIVGLLGVGLHVVSLPKAD